MPRMFVPRGLEASALFPVFARKRQQGNMTGPFDGSGYFTLMLCACTGLAAWTNLAVIRDIAFEKLYVFIVNDLLFIRAKLTELWAGVKATSTASTTTRSATKVSFFSHLLLHLVISCYLLEGKFVFVRHRF